MENASYRRLFYFAIFLAASCFVFWKALRNLFRFALVHDYGSYIFLIVPISASLIYLKRRGIFTNPRSSPFLGSILLLAGAILGSLSIHSLLPSHDFLWLEIFALIVIWISGFLLCYGVDAFRAARFPLLFLLLFIPVPDSLIQKAILFLQQGSASAAFWLFRFLHVPVFRDGVLFHIPTLDLEVTSECSGIRSSIVLLITVLLVSEFTLHSVWRRAVLVLSIIPIAILKNGLRIVTISLLTIYVNRRFLHGWLHQSGGVVFYLLGLLALVPIVVLLRKGESGRSAGSGADPIVANAALPDRVRE